MKTLNDYFDQIYCINLDKRKDRWKIAKEQFDFHNIEVSRFSAVDGKTLNSNPYISRGAFGCLLSHLNVLKDARENRYKTILITEDDVEFSDNLNVKFFKYEIQLPKWDILYLGANHALCNPYEQNPPIQVNENVYKVNHAYALHAYAVKQSCYDFLIDNISEMNNSVDVIISKIQKHLEVYLFRPHLAWQSSGYSDIMEKDVNYSFLKN
jgi:GR25 family glycosyltransferase involved in LPS biosynthesis